MVCNLDCEFGRHNIFLNNNKLITLLHPAAAASRDVAIVPVTIALLAIDGPAVLLNGAHDIWFAHESYPLAYFLACCLHDAVIAHRRLTNPRTPLE